MTVLDLDDLFAPEVNADPFTYFAHLRQADPVHWNERFQLWVVTRYEDVVWLLRHHEFFSSAVIKTTTQPPYPPVDPEDVPLFDEPGRPHGGASPLFRRAAPGVIFTIRYMPPVVAVVLWFSLKDTFVLLSGLCRIAIPS